MLIVDEAEEPRKDPLIQQDTPTSSNMCGARNLTRRPFLQTFKKRYPRSSDSIFDHNPANPTMDGMRRRSVSIAAIGRTPSPDITTKIRVRWIP